MPKENKTRYALLGMLTYRPMSGYDMKKMSDHSISHFWNENFGSIYPVLKRMESEGLVIKNRDERNDGPARNTYTITDEGRRVLTEWLERDPEPRILREELLLQVFYGQWTAPDVIVTKLKKELKRSEGMMTELRVSKNILSRRLWR
jgi:PadR family transcriptional regulator AphA